MADLLNAVLNAHGGLDNWREFSQVQATIVTGGGLWAIKGQPQDPLPRRMTVALDHEWASLTPFGADDQKTAFSPGRLRSKSSTAESFPSGSTLGIFDGHEFATPWDPLQRAYFNGYALWTYLTTPFLLALEGVSVREIAPVEEHGEPGSACRRSFRPRSRVTRPVQEFYFGEDHLLRRHDYRVDVAGAFPAVQYVTAWSKPRASSFPRNAGPTGPTPRQLDPRSAHGRNRPQRHLPRLARLILRLGIDDIAWVRVPHAAHHPDLRRLKPDAVSWSPPPTLSASFRVLDRGARHRTREGVTGDEFREVRRSKLMPSH